MELAKMFTQDALAEFVPVRGVVHLMTSLGVFLDVQSRRVFVGTLCMLQMPDRILGPGEDVSLHVSRCYAEQEGLVGAFGVVKATTQRAFAEANAVTMKDLRFWAGMTVWIAPPLLALIVWAVS